MAGQTPTDEVAAASSASGGPRASRNLFYGWWLIGAAGVLQMLNGALLGHAFGAYVVVLREEFGWSKTILSAASSLREMEAGVVGPVQGVMLSRFGPRKIAYLGVVIMGVGFMLFSQIQNVPQFMTTFLIISIGASFCGYLTLTFAAVQWFERRRATALSLMAAGGATGGLLVPITVWAMETFGWRATSFASGVVILVVGLGLSYFIRWRPADYGMHIDGIVPTEAPVLDASGGTVDADGTRDFTFREAVRTRVFWFVSFGHGSALFIVSALNVHFFAYLTELGLSKADSAKIQLMLPLLFLVGTLLGGPFGDRFSKRWLAVVCMWAHAIAIVGIAYSTAVPLIVGFAILHGLAWGLRGPQMAAIRADYFGRQAFPQIMGVSNSIIIIGTIAGPIIAGLVYDSTGSYKIGFVILGVLAAAGSVFFMLAPKPARPIA